MSKGKEKALWILEQVKSQYENTTTSSDDDKDNLKEVNEAIRWVKSK